MDITKNTMHITPVWDIQDIINLNIQPHENPHRGFNAVKGLDESFYKNITDIGVYHGLPSFLNEDYFNKEFSWIKHKGYSIHRMLPNTMLPLHRDKYSYYSKKLGIEDLNTIIRVIVFLEDHKIGHVLQIEGTPVHEWKAGDYVLWRGQKAHLAANFGLEDRYTLQITGIIK